MRERPEVLDYIARNREALDDSISRCEAEFPNGVCSKRSIADVIRDGRRRHSGRDGSPRRR
jgi:hypothetical protein